ncbi:MAG TPA: type II toxin-antitoxin system prevent-host-death family antitoxin [Dictyoglomaceae bacterium]|nr:type II toxin-antitoxin system prevent-host-death family antitoxin [Dictyoglomaceae bacterium]
MKTKVVPIREFKNKATQLLREKDEIIITRRGIPIARVEPLDELNGLMIKARLEMEKANITEEEAIEILRKVKEEV